MDLRFSAPGIASITRACRERPTCVDAPTTTEWAAWRTVPRRARIYNATLVCAALVVTAGSPFVTPVDGDSLGVLAVLIAAGMALAVISRLNSPEDEIYLKAQLDSPGFYLVEFAVLASGALAAVLYRYWPGFLLLAGPVYLLIQRGMLHQPLQHQARHDAKTGVLNSEAWRAPRPQPRSTPRAARRGWRRS